jgi:hypothetical protein
VYEAALDEVGMRLTAPREAHQREGHVRFTLDRILAEEMAVLDLVDARDNRSWPGRQAASWAAWARRCWPTNWWPIRVRRCCTSRSRVIPADPLTVYDALSDITTIGQRSPETHTAKWIELVTVVRGPITALATDG